MIAPTLSCKFDKFKKLRIHIGRSATLGRVVSVVLSGHEDLKDRQYIYTMDGMKWYKMIDVKAYPMNVPYELMGWLMGQFPGPKIKRSGQSVKTAS